MKPIGLDAGGQARSPGQPAMRQSSKIEPAWSETWRTAMIDGAKMGGLGSGSDARELPPSIHVQSAGGAPAAGQER